MMSSGRIKWRWFEAVYTSDFSAMSKNKNYTNEDMFFNIFFKVLKITFCGEEISMIRLKCYKKIYAVIVHKILYDTAGSQSETVM